MAPPTSTQDEADDPNADKEALRSVLARAGRAEETGAEEALSADEILARIGGRGPGEAAPGPETSPGVETIAEWLQTLAQQTADAVGVTINDRFSEITGDKPFVKGLLLGVLITIVVMILILGFVGAFVAGFLLPILTHKP